MKCFYLVVYLSDKYINEIDRIKIYLKSENNKKKLLGFFNNLPSRKPLHDIVWIVPVHFKALKCDGYT